ncbi:MAG: spore cortex biosynthesis protein YabQ [Clostridiales bacterium]|nr:spore cortex biosynthesis protein YabQ [Clostridiales bacterium]
MTYGVSLAKQTCNFFIAVGTGFAIGIVYDFFFIIRNLISKRKWVTFICDALFTVSASLLSFLLLLIITDGQIRAYVIFGEAIGFFVYYFSLGVFIVRLCDKITRILKRFFAFLKRILLFIFKVVSYPFRKLYAVFSSFFKKIYEKMRKNAKKVVKKSKFLLQVDTALLYNQRVYKGSLAQRDTRYRKGRNKNRGK